MQSKYAFAPLFVTTAKVAKVPVVHYRQVTVATTVLNVQHVQHEAPRCRGRYFATSCGDAADG